MIKNVNPKSEIRVNLLNLFLRTTLLKRVKAAIIYALVGPTFGNTKIINGKRNKIGIKVASSSFINKLKTFLITFIKQLRYIPLSEKRKIKRVVKGVYKFRCINSFSLLSAILDRYITP